MSFYPSDNDKMAIRAALILIALTVAAALFLAGCGEARQPDPSPSTVADTVGQLGVTLTWVGGICSAAGVALRLISFFYPPIAGLGAFFGFLAIGGAGVTATGAYIQWLADNPWVMVAGIVASLGAVGWWYWPVIKRALDRRLAGKV